jgi:hypothetical protein
MRRNLPRPVWLLAVGLIGAAFGSAGSASAAQLAAPAWQISINAYSSNFRPSGIGAVQHGPTYEVNVRNVGAVAAEGEMTIEDRLPAGVLVAPVGVEGKWGDSIFHSGYMTCQVSGGVVSCTTEGPIFPGLGARVKIPLELPLGEEGVLIDEADVHGGGASPRTVSVETPVTSAIPAFGFIGGPFGAFGEATDAGGEPVTVAGTHPYQLTVSMNLASEEPGVEGGSTRTPNGGVKVVRGELAKGMVVDPQAVPTCTEQELESEFAACPPQSQIGTARVTLSITGQTFYELAPLYNMATPPGRPASFGFEVLEIAYIHLLGRVRSDGDFGLSADAESLPSRVGVLGTEITLWGDPTDPSHDAVRGKCLAEYSKQTDCPSERLETAFLTMPSACTASSSENILQIEGWEGATASAVYSTTDLDGNAQGVDGCGALRFEPSLEVRPTTAQGESPSGLDFDLHQTQDVSYEGRSTANLKTTEVALPSGIMLNPSAANGREGCSSSQLGTDGSEPAHCPDASKIGSLEVKTPLVDHPLPGSIFLARPFENPFHSLLAFYIAVDDPVTGIVTKLPAKVEPDASTGQLTTIVEESPELPLEDIDLHFFEGPRGVLTTPLTCGAHETTSTLAPWSTPEGADAHPSDSFQISSGCSSSEAAAPKSVSFTAGTQSPLSGAYSPFVLRLSRPDGSQHITGIDTTLPPGLLGKLAGVAYCPQSGIDQAIGREHPEMGKLEQQQASCPQSSEVGTVNVTAGSGSSPIPVSGHAYLAGPYKGAPLSLVVIVPAVAGPFDLGTVVDRVALNVDEYTAQIHAVSDPLPTIREGIPLDVRSIEVKLDRSSFTLNPTSCEAMAIGGSVSTQAGQSQSLSNRFQVGDCERLAFKPKLQLSLKGGTKKTGHPAVKAVVTVPQQGEFANIARAQVNLPHSEFLDQGNIAKACTKVILAQRACPATSIYGKAKAWTPLLEKPLEGPVYLVGGYGYKLPALVAELDGQIRVLLVGKVDSGKNHGIRNTFEAVPDAPVSRFVLELKGGEKYGLLENSENLCEKPQKAGVVLRAQNGRKKSLTVKVGNSCRKGKKKQGPRRHR